MLPWRITVAVQLVAKQKKKNYNLYQFFFLFVEDTKDTNISWDGNEMKKNKVKDRNEGFG